MCVGSYSEWHFWTCWMGLQWIPIAYNMNRLIVKQLGCHTKECAVMGTHVRRNSIWQRMRERTQLKEVD